MRGRRDSGRMRLKAAVAAFVLVAGIALLYQAGRWLEMRNAKPETRGDYTQRYAYGETIEVDGVAYRRKANLTSILLMGIDQESGGEQRLERRTGGLSAAGDDRFGCGHGVLDRD